MKPGILRSERGQDLVEFAITISVFMVFTLVTLDLGRAVYYFAAVHNAAREGARKGAVHPPNEFACDGDYDSSEIVNAARGRVTGLNPAVLLVTIICPDEDTIQVGVSYPFSPVTPLVGSLLDDSLFITSQAGMRIER